jgi:hypothetical protein
MYINVHYCIAFCLYKTSHYQLSAQCYCVPTTELSEIVSLACNLSGNDSNTAYKTLRSAHTFVSEGLLKHFPRFSSSFLEFEAKFQTHTHVVPLPSPSFTLPKKVASRLLHLFTSAALARLLAVIERCDKKRCVTKCCRKSAPLAAVRSVHWFRRCALSSVFFIKTL